MRLIDGHPHYLVQEDGSVFSLRAGRYLRLQAASNGYRFVKLGRGKPHLVHRLVAAAFVANPDGKPHVNHKDANRENNHFSNLEWVTPSENHTHAHSLPNRKPHGLSRAVRVGGEIVFEDMCDAAAHLRVFPGSVASAAARGHRCRGKEISYVD
jgi:hypothetical protein